MEEALQCLVVPKLLILKGSAKRATTAYITIDRFINLTAQLATTYNVETL